MSEWLTAIGDRVEVYLAHDGWRWRVVASNGEKLEGGEAHTEQHHAEAAARRYHAPPAEEHEAVQPEGQ